MERDDDASAVSSSAGATKRRKIHLSLHATKLPSSGVPPNRRPPDAFAKVSIVPLGALLLGATTGHVEETDVTVVGETDRDKAIVGGTDGGGTEPESIGSTEVIKKSSQPRWSKVFLLDHVPDTKLNFFVEVCNANKNDKVLGGAMFEVDDILQSRNRTKAKRLRKGGHVFAHIDEGNDVAGDEGAFAAVAVPESAHGLGSSAAAEGATIRLVFRALDLKKNLSSAFGSMVVSGGSDFKPDTFLEIARQSSTPSGTSWVVVHRSAPIESCRTPTWEPIELDLETFCNSDVEKPIRVSVHVRKKSGKHKLHGSFETNVTGLLEMASSDAANAAAGGGNNSAARSFVLRKGSTATSSAKEVGRIAVHEGYVSYLDGTRHPQPRAVDADGEECLMASTGLAAPSPIAPPPPPPASTPSPLSTPGAPRGKGKEDDDGTCTSSIATVLRMQRRANEEAAKEAANRGGGEGGRKTSRETFERYVGGSEGCDVDFCVAIDFTSSNGDPRVPGTLHYSSNGALNDYEETILTVGSAISRYSVSKEFPVWGFGAKYGGVVRHIFRCGPNETADDVSGVLDAYRDVFRTDLTMSGPTVLLDVIRAAASRAKGFHQRNVAAAAAAARQAQRKRYCVLLILTDGIVTDMDSTKRLLSSASTLPLSVVIVGIGGADFAPMRTISSSSDGGGGGTTSRRNVTFAEYRPHQHDPDSLNREALRSVPDQIVEYFVRNRMPPPPPSSFSGNGDDSPATGRHRRAGSAITVDSAISDLTFDA